MNSTPDRDAPSAEHDLVLDERQRRERDYHNEFAKRYHDIILQPVSLGVLEPGPRRPWNGSWTAYEFLIAESLAGKRVMIPGCGFGDDAIRLAKLGAEVHAFDLSPELLEIARQRAAKIDVTSISFKVMPAEALAYPDNFFDLVYFSDILHHVNIPRAVSEARRVLKPEKVIANELYTHSILQKIRESRLVAGFLYPRMTRFVYGTGEPYITQNEHKINEHELNVLIEILQSYSLHQKYFSLFAGRIFPARWWVEKFDYAFLRTVGSAGRILAGRVVLVGLVAK